MKIEKIKKLPSGKYKIELDSSDKFVTYDDVILKNNLLFNKEIDSKKLNEINKDTNYFELYNKTISLIGRRLRSEKEVNEYLDKNTNNDKDKKRIIDDLKKIGLINDKVFTKAFISDKLNLSNIGPILIREELENHQIDQKIIEEEMNNIDNDLVFDKLTRLINKKINANHKHSTYIIKQKIMNDMLNNGYDREMIINILENINCSNNIIEKEFDKLYSKLSKNSTKDIYIKLKNKLYQKGFELDEINELINRKIGE